MLSDRTGGGNEGEAPREEFGEQTHAGRIEQRVETFGDLGGGVAHRARHTRHETEPFEQHEDRNDGNAEPCGRSGVGIDRHDGDTPRRCGGTERTTGGDDDDRASRLERSLGRSDSTSVVARRRYDDGKRAITHPRRAASACGHDRHGGAQFADRLDHITGDASATGAEDDNRLDPPGVGQLVEIGSGHCDVAELVR